MKFALLGAALLFSIAAHSQTELLFETLEYQQHSSKALSGAADHASSHTAIKVRINKALLAKQRQQFQRQRSVTPLRRREAFALSLPDGSVHDIVITRVTNNTNNGFSLFGHISGQPQYKVALNSINDTAFAGTVMLDDVSYKIMPAGDGLALIEPIVGEEHQCGGGQTDHELERQIKTQLTPQLEQLNQTQTLNSAALSQIDVMLIYTAAARSGAGGTNSMQALAQQSVDQMNLSLENSAVNARVNLVYANEIAYQETGNGYTDLDWVTSNSAVARLRDQYAADLVGMILENPGNLCGLGWYMGTPSVSFASRGFQITRRSCVGGWTIAHEFGHNMGLQHDRANAGGTPGPTQYNYGHILANNTHTIMAYGSSCNWCPAINHFSNPDVYYNGYATGSAYHNNARRLNDTRAIVANFRQGSNTTPPDDDFQYQESSDLNARGYAIMPKNNYGYYYARAGLHQAELAVSTSGSADFDLYLQRWNGYQWVTVASSTSPGNDERISYNGSAAYYRWYIYSYAGAGTATLSYNLPQ